MSLRSRGAWLVNGVRRDNLAGHEDLAAKLAGQHEVFNGCAVWVIAAAGEGLRTGTGWEMGVSSGGSQ